MSTMGRSFIGAGSIYFKPADNSTPLLPVGNVCEFEFSFKEDKKELKNYLGGGNRNTISRISSITASLTAHDLTATTLAMALRGSTTALTSMTR